MNSILGQELVYRIDADSTILSVSENWNAVLQCHITLDNEYPQPVGTRLWNHLGDPTTIHLYQAIVARVRRSRQEFVIPFRCDSPERRRYMQMRVREAAAGAIEFHSAVIREELRPCIPLLDARARHSSDLLRMCSWCKKVPLPDWVEVEEAVRRLKLFESETMPRITHTICPDCREMIQAEIDRCK